MTDIDDFELSQRLRALRVEPPGNGFEARLAERLWEVVPDAGSPTPEATPAQQVRGARVVVGPWLRRGPTRLIGAAALLMAGAAAALDGGVVEWVQTRIFSAPPEDAPAPTAPSRPLLERRAAPSREFAPVTEAPSLLDPSLLDPALLDPAPLATPPLATPRAEAGSELAPPLAPPDVPRLSIERHEPRRRESTLGPERRPRAESLAVPRVEIDPGSSSVRRDSPEARVERVRSSPATRPSRERERDLDRIRDIARARRERAGGVDRPRGLERLRERVDRAAERRDLPSDRGRRERPIK